MPNSQQIHEAYLEWKSINAQLESIYQQLAGDLQELTDKYRQLEGENKESHDKINALKLQYAEAIRTNTIQHSELAKNLS